MQKLLVRLMLLIVASFMVSLTASSVRAQRSADTIDWQTFSPEGEEFSVTMPKDPKFEDGQESYHRMTLNTRLYLSTPGNGPVFAIASLSGIKANSAMYTEAQRLNSYVDAFKNWFPQKVRGKDAIAKLTPVGDKVLNGNNGREYKLVIGDLSGTAQMYATRRRFYAVVVLNTKKDDELTEHFLSSLVLPEKAAQAQTAVTVVPTERAAPTERGAVASQSKNQNSDDSQKSGATAVPPTENKPTDGAAGHEPAGPAPINGGVLNGKAMYLPPPEYPAVAAAAKAAGTVVVQILIDEVGNVISAHAVSGHPLLQAASVAAARQARFAPTSLSGTPVKVTGVVTYNFVAQ